MAKLRKSMSKVNLTLPDDAELLKAVGRVALAHGQLELMLRMTIKTLSRLTVNEAMNATEKWKNWELRVEIEKLFRAKTNDPSLRLKVKALMGQSEHLSDRRNELLHGAFAITNDGSVVAKGADDKWGPPPEPEVFKKLADDIGVLVNDLNEARLRGFIRQVCEEAEAKA